jgi:hypothetical protein
VNVPAPGEPGDREYGDAECCLVGWNWPAACMATVVAPVDGWPALVVMLRLAEGFVVEEVAVEGVAVDWKEGCVVPATADGDDVAAFCMLEWARKAERKLPKKGLFVGILLCVCNFSLESWGVCISANGTVSVSR